jgi:hypothetical protein
MRTIAIGVGSLLALAMLGFAIWLLLRPVGPPSPQPPLGTRSGGPEPATNGKTSSGQGTQDHQTFPAGAEPPGPRPPMSPPSPPSPPTSGDQPQLANSAPRPPEGSHTAPGAQVSATNRSGGRGAAGTPPSPGPGPSQAAAKARAQSGTTPGPPLGLGERPRTYWGKNGGTRPGLGLGAAGGEGVSPRTAARIPLPYLDAQPGVSGQRFPGEALTDGEQRSLGRLPGDVWRYRWFDNRWWYWTPENRWVYFDNCQWQPWPVVCWPR